MNISQTDLLRSVAPRAAERLPADVIQALEPIRPSDLKTPAVEGGEEFQPTHERHTGWKYIKAQRGFREEGLTARVPQLAELWRAEQHASCVPQEAAVVQQARQQRPVEPRQDVVSAAAVEYRRIRRREQADQSH